MPYIPFPASWPVYTPAQKVRLHASNSLPILDIINDPSQLADWLEFYADSMEVDYWTEAKVLNARRETSGPNKGKWEVTVERADKNRVLYVDHVVFAIGVGGGTPNMPKIPGMVSAAVLCKGLYSEYSGNCRRILRARSFIRLNMTRQRTMRERKLL